jgi:GxxExxY protein
MTKTYLDNLTYRILGAAIEVHKHLGPGLLESVYQKCLMRELELRNIEFKSQILTELNYKECLVPAELRCDLLVENAIVIELKACESTLPVHEGQLLTYMRLLQKPKGILINFNSINIIKQGQKTFVNDIFKNLPD